MSVNASSLTCYALLSSMERDLRNLILEVAAEADASEILGPELLKKTLERRQKDQPRSASTHLSSLLVYVDFADSYQIMCRLTDRLPEVLSTALKEIGPKWDRIIPIRNRVAHSRPLELDDLPNVVDFSKEFIGIPGADWAETRRARAELDRNPGYVLGLNLDLIKDDASNVRHNLPPADFDETGFLGRVSQRKELLRSLKGPWPVISVLGDGGLGKTALALQVAYDLIDDPNCEFDAVVWTSAKNARLTTSEIVRVENAIQDSLGLFAGAAEELGGSAALNDPVGEVLEYLENFKILLVLDNLETVIDDKVRDFLRALPHGSKVLITSRIGVGTENPLKLSPLTLDEGVRMLRTLARVRRIDRLMGLHADQAESLVTRMRCHPAFIKWFASGVQAGLEPERLVENNGLLLDYCMSNVFDYLGDEARAVLRSMLVLQGARTLAELSFINQFDAAKIQRTVLELTTTNFVSQVKGGAQGTGYALSDFAKSYLQKNLTVPVDERKWLLGKHKELYRFGGSLQAAHSRNPFSPETIDTRNAGNYSAARQLRIALDVSKDGHYERAIDLCREASELAPGYHEPYRVAGYIHEEALNFAEAFDAYDAARDLAQEYAPVRYFLGKFLVTTGFSPRQGLAELQMAARLDESPAIRLAVAEAHLILDSPADALGVAADLIRAEAGPEWTSRALTAAARAAASAGYNCRLTNDSSGFAEVCESLLEPLEDARVEDISLAVLDRCMLLEKYCDEAGAQASEEFIARRCIEFSRRLRERRRQADHHHLSRQVGTVISIVSERGFGFIDRDGKQYFLHASEMLDKSEFDLLEVNMLTAFRPGLVSQGARPRATEVSIL
jgi:LuxR family glucitol operon transcriptional activator